MPSPTPLAVFSPPYRTLEPFAGNARALRRHVEGRPGVFLIWSLGGEGTEPVTPLVRGRPPGTALVVVLPPAERVAGMPDVLRVVETCRPQSVLPFHEEPSVQDLLRLARRPPDDLPAEVTDYLAWRGLPLDTDTRHLVRRTLEMSAEVRTVAALARGLYQSRRALGRRFLSAGLPVPSHWLHFGRVLRAAIRLQSSDDGLFTVACDLGYPDGFALSNQMKRLTGLRPTTVREYLGWEWILETWLRREAERGSLSPETAAVLLPTPPARPPTMTGPGAPRSRRARSERS